MADRTFHKRFTLTARIGVAVFTILALYFFWVKMAIIGIFRGYHHRGHDRAHTEYNLYLQDGKTDRPG